MFFIAVQCERKPIEVSREKSSNCAASTEKIYIRKDLRSPLAATPTFVTDGETTRCHTDDIKKLDPLLLFPHEGRLKFGHHLFQVYRTVGFGNVRKYSPAWDKNRTSYADDTG